MLQKVIPELDPQSEMNGCLERWYEYSSDVTPFDPPHPSLFC
jgi:hypothetical protein